MAMVPSGSGGGPPVIAEVEMNGGADSGAATVRATVVQASTVFYDTPATLGKHSTRTLNARVCPPPPPPCFGEFSFVVVGR